VVIKAATSWINNGVALCRPHHTDVHRLLRHDVEAYRASMEALMAKRVNSAPEAAAMVP